MKASYEWLKEYVDIRVSPEILAKKLTMAGLEVGRLQKCGTDTIFEIEITANRPDCLSILGIAQEAAAVMGAKLQNKIEKVQISKKGTSGKKLKSNFITIEDKNDCLLYRGCLIEDVKVGPSPEWLRRRLESLGVRSVNNVVDITNYCLFLYGQPLHAFDHDKLQEKIIVRRAKRNEKFITIDGDQQQLDEKILVISDANKSIAIAGIMGGKDSEVVEQTTTILLESAYFDPILTRRASRQLGLSTESSYRFERGVDLQWVKLAQDKAVSMIRDLAKGRLIDVQQAGKKINLKQQTVSLDCRKINKILSLAISRNTISKILVSLGFSCRKAGVMNLNVAIPISRRDIISEEDLVEEVARIYGYDNIPSTMPAVRTNLIENSAVEETKPIIGQHLRGLGYYEAITYSLVSQTLLDAACVKSEAVRLMNPLTKEQELLRPLIAQSLINCIVYNLNRNNNDLRLFEVSHVFNIDKGEVPSLGIIATGKYKDNWQIKKEFDLFVLKGDTTSLLERLGVKDVGFIPSSSSLFQDEEAVDIVVQGTIIGMIGRINDEVLLHFDIKNNPRIFYVEIFLDECSQFINFDRRFKSLAIFPSAFRDLSLIVRQSVRYGDLVEAIKGQAGSYLRNLLLTDVYQGKQIPEGFMGMTISLEYGLDERTLTDEAVGQVQDKIIQKLTSDFEVKIR